MKLPDLIVVVVYLLVCWSKCVGPRHLDNRASGEENTAE